MTEKIKVVWREWYNENAVKQLTEMGTLPRDETEIDAPFDWEDGEDVARDLATTEYQNGSELFREAGAQIVILEPEKYAGTYEIDIEYVPNFLAYAQD